MKTNKKKLALLKQERDTAVKAYNEYLGEFNKEHGTGRTLIKEIIDLHKQGKTNKEIVAEGYNKHTVSGHVSMYKKGMISQKTIVAKYLPDGEESENEE